MSKSSLHAQPLSRVAKAAVVLDILFGVLALGRTEALRAVTNLEGAEHLPAR